MAQPVHEVSSPNIRVASMSRTKAVSRETGRRS